MRNISPTSNEQGKGKKSNRDGAKTNKAGLKRSRKLALCKRAKDHSLSAWPSAVFLCSILEDLLDWSL
jgi:hypothetical protein